MEDKKQKRSDPLLAFAIISSVYSLGTCIFRLVIYLLKKTKFNLNERYEDERKVFISEKSSSTSYNILFIAIVILKYLISSNRIIITTNHALNLIVMSALLIKLSTYLIYKYKY